MTARWRVVPASVAAALLVPGALLVTATPAAGDPAAGDTIGLSADGVEFADSLETPLFSDALTWVPGDRRSRAVWVRNRAEQDAVLSVGVPEESPVPGWLSLDARDEGAWSPVAERPAVVGDVLEPGEARRVALRVGMARGAPSSSMRASADLRIRIRLTEARDTAPGGLGPTDPTADPDDPTATPGGLLPDTGARFGPVLVVVALWLVAAGASVLRHRGDES